MSQADLGTRRLARYVLVERLDDGRDSASSLWRGVDEVLDREVTVRLLDRDDPRYAAFIGAARAAALVDDRRLLRILDILDAHRFAEAGDAAGDVEPDDVAAVVSEWGTGRTLEQLATPVDGQTSAPMRAAEATAVVGEVARAISAGLDDNVAHGRLRPSSVIVTDAGEVRVRGLAVDAALMGPLVPGLDRSAADVDALGCLLYLLTTGRWPGPPVDGLVSAGRAGDVVLAPSRIEASVPRAIDDVVARSVRAADRPRGLTNITDARGFVASLSVARDRVDPIPHVRLRSPRHPIRRSLLSVLAVVVAVGIGVVGFRLVSDSSTAWQRDDASANGDFLTEAAVPATVEIPGVEQILPITSVRSFDPFGDDDGDGKRDRKKGRENDEDAANIVDGDETTSWRSDTYREPDAGKGGVGVILDLGEQRPVRAVDLHFAEVGAAVEVRIADEVLANPLTWSLLAQAPAGAQDITLRAPRPIDGRYVLLWFPELPLVPGYSSTYGVDLTEIQIRG